MATNEAKWPPSPCERVMNKDGDICAVAATYRPGFYAYLCNQHTDEATRRLQRVNAELLAALEECFQFICHANYELDPIWKEHEDRAYGAARVAIAAAKDG